MGKAIIILLAAISYKPCYSQIVLCASAGVGITTSAANGTTPILAAEVYYHKTPHVNLGFSFSLDDFSIHSKQGVSSVYLDAQIRSHYLFFTPKFDLGIGRSRWFHFLASFVPGIYIYGAQNSTMGYFTSRYYYNYDRFHTSSNFTKIILQLGVGIRQNVKINKQVSLIFTQEYAPILSNLAKYSHQNVSVSIHTSYVSAQVGIMYYLQGRKKISQQ